MDLSEMDLSEVPVVGAFASAGAVAADVIIQGGDIILLLSVTILDTIDLWLPMLSYLDRLAEQIPAIPQHVTSQLLTAGLVLIVAWYAYRLLVQLHKLLRRNSTNENEN